MAGELSTTDEWYCRVSDAELGPVPVQTLRRLIALGQVTAEDHVRLGASGSWQRVRDILELKSALNQPTAAGSASDGVGPQPRSAAPRDEWYYELGARVHGPLTRIALDDLVGACGDTAVEVRVRCGRNGEWLPYRDFCGPRLVAEVQPTRLGDAALTAASKSSRPSQPVGGQATRRVKRVRPRGHADPRDAYAFLTAHRELAALVGIWIFANLTLLFWPQTYGTERRSSDALRAMMTEMDGLSARHASASEWLAFADRSHATLARIAKELQKSERSDSSQLLISAARTIAPKLCNPPSADRDQSEQQLRECLDRVDGLLGLN